MNQKYYKGPSNVELCQIAAAIYGLGATKDPRSAARVAVALWLSVSHEHSCFMQRDYKDNLREYFGESSDLYLAETKRLDEAVAKQAALLSNEIVFGTSKETSEAMQWLIEKAKDPRDHFKSFRAFQIAWDAIFAENSLKARQRCCERTMHQFISRRKEMRRITDAARKRVKREHMKRSVKKKSLPD